jgi:Arc/MetJ family transcription regulator
MKTQIDISDELLAEAEALAARDGVTLRALIESGLRREVRERKNPRSRFSLRDASVGGTGLHPDVQDLSWNALRDIVYSTPE